MNVLIGIVGLIIRLAAFVKVVRLFRFTWDIRLILLTVILTGFIVHPILNMGFSSESWDNLPFSLMMLYLGTSFLAFASAHFIGYYVKQYDQSNKQLQQYTQVFDQFIRTCPMMYFIIEGDHIVYCNPATVALTGRSRDELFSNMYWDIVHPDYSDLIKKIITSRREDDTIVQEKIQLITKAGEVRWVHIMFTAVTFNDKPAIAASAHDITKQIQSETALLLAEERLRLAVDANELVVWDYYPERDEITLENVTAALSEHLTTNTFSFSNFLNRVDSDDQSRVDFLIKSIVGRNIRFSIEFRATYDLEEYKWWRMEGRSFKEQEGQPARIVGTSRCIQTEKMAEKVITKHREQLKLATQAAGIRLWEWDIRSNTINVDLNDSSGERDSVMDFQEFSEKIHPLHRERFNSAILDCLNQDTLYHQEFPLCTTGETHEWLLSLGRPLFDEAGQPVRMLGASIDITEQKEKDKLIHFQAYLLETSGQSVVAQNTKGEIVYWNKAAKELFGDPDADTLPYNVNEIIPKEHRIINDTEIMSLLRAGKRWSGERVAYLKNQATIPFHITVSPYHNEFGEFDGFTLVATDLSEYKRIQDALEKSEEHLRIQMQQLQTITENIPDRLIRIDKQYNILFDNEMTGCAPAEIEKAPLPVNLRDYLKNSAVRNLWEKKLARVFHRGVAEEFEYDVYDEKTSGKRYYNAIVVPEKTLGDDLVESSDEQEFVIGIVRDTTERHRMQRTISDMSARQQRKIGQDLHDELGQLLTGVGFLVTSLSQDLKTQHHEGLDQLVEINRLVEKAIAQTRILAEGLNPVTLELNGLRTSLERLTLHTEQLYNVRCSFECNSDFDEIKDETAYQVYRIAQEAINNSVKHSGASEINVSLLRKDNEVRLFIVDNGTGFDVNSIHGDGQGVQIMKYRSIMIEGELLIHSCPELGTTINCIFPYNTDKDIVNHVFA